jgi:glycosyltransferase involved in cell wall biosynthesis
MLRHHRAPAALCEHARMRVALDATPLLGTRSGVGEYVARLVEALSAIGAADEIRLTAFSWRGQRELEANAPKLPRVVTHSRRVPARLLRDSWSRSAFPPVELFAGGVDVFHGTNFVLPPTRRAAGVVTIHDLTFELHPDTVDASSLAYRRLVPRALTHAARVVTPSQATADDLVAAYGFDRDRIDVTPLGVDAAWALAAPASESWRQATGIPERYLLFVGTLEPRKNVPELLAAHAELRAADPATPPLVLAGPAGWGDVASRPELGAEGVIQAGYLPAAQLRALVAGAALLCLPSRYEGFGLPPLEAMACGVPVVVSDIPVLREVTGGLGRYVPVGDVPALATALQETLEDPGDAAPRRSWAAECSWTRCAQLTAASYRKAADSR